MKKYISKYIMTFAAALVLLTGCELESGLYSQIGEGMGFPSNAEDATALVTGTCYTIFSPWGIFYPDAGYFTNSEMVTDIGENSWGWTTVYNSYEADDWHIDSNTRCQYRSYNYISMMTLTLHKIKDVAMDEKLKERLMAEVKCGQGFLAFILYDLYGPIQIADLETLLAPKDEKLIPRRTDEEMHQFIETNLQEAAQVLPYSYSAGEYGRFTKGLANTLLLKFYMLTKQWPKAEAIGRELTKPEYGYRLVDDYNTLFDLGTEQNTETIYAAAAKAGVIEHKWHAHVLPSDFPTPAGVTITKWGGFKVAWPFYETYEAGDKRLQRLVGEYTGTEGVLHNRKNDRDSGTQGQLYKGAVPQKFGLEGVTGENCEIDIPIYRYADVITLLAEAIVRNTNSVSQEAIEHLNAVRTRAGLLPYSAADFDGVQDFLDKLLLERGHEFYYEGVRRQDLIRHGKFIEAAVKKAEFEGQPTGKITTQVDGKYKYERFPIPPSIIYESQGLVTQNPGY